jgi:phosphoribosylanthranilate isomerase
MIVHASAITNLTDARYFAAKAGVHYLGFHLEPDATDYLDPVFMKAIKEWVEGPAITAWFFETPVPIIIESAQFYGLDAVVLPLNVQNKVQLARLGQLTYQLIASPSEFLENEIELAQVPNQPEAIILDLRGQEWSNINDEGMKAEMVREICRRRKTLLYCNPSNLSTLAFWKEAVQPAGFCLSGGSEERVGVKEFDNLEDIFDWLETE